MRKLIKILETYDIDDSDSIDSEPTKPYRFLNYLDKYRVEKHKERLNREKWREKQRKRFERDVGDAEETPFMSKRTIQKSVVGYKPFEIPLIRFGKFGNQSRNFLPASYRKEMGNVTHESGVSCYLGYPYKDGFSFNLPHPDRAAYDVTHWSFRPTESELRGLLNYIDHKIPMDIFLIRGHLKSHGRGNSWLDLGADGEYLLDTSKPFKQETISPERIYVLPGKTNLVDYILKLLKTDVEGLRKYLEND